MNLNYSIRLLTDKLRENREELLLWERKLNSDDELEIRQAKRNYPACENRIEDLKNGIQIIKSYR